MAAAALIRVGLSALPASRLIAATGAALVIIGIAVATAAIPNIAQTGYDANAVMDFHFHHKGFLCGTNASEAKAAILVQRANKP